MVKTVTVYIVWVRWRKTEPREGRIFFCSSDAAS